MISLTHARRYQDLHSGFQECLAYLESFDPATPAGRYEINGTACFALVDHYETGPAASKPFEAHRKYIDMQYLAKGCESIGISTVEKLSATMAYCEEEDYQLFSGDDAGSACVLQAGDLAVFFPEDVHKPGCQIGEGPLPVIKIVVKIPV